MATGIYPIEKRRGLFLNRHKQLNTGRTRFKKGQIPWTKDRSLTKEHRINISLAKGGNGIVDLVKKRHIHTTGTKEYRQWRSDVFQRDNWTCQTCGAKSSKGIRILLEAHHIKGWANYPDLRYGVDNGITLCRECHKLTRKKGFVSFQSH